VTEGFEHGQAVARKPLACSERRGAGRNPGRCSLARFGRVSRVNRAIAASPLSRARHGVTPFKELP
jgi:hypothetical protein